MNEIPAICEKNSSEGAELVERVEQPAIESADATMRVSAAVDGDQGAQPSIGTLAWLQLQEHVEWQGIELPHCHRAPEGSTLHPEQNGFCRLVKANGERCRAPGTRLYGLCLVHAGGGGTADLDGMRRKSAEKRARLKMTKQMLGVGQIRSADPRQTLRVLANARSFELAEAMLAPLDDVELGSMAKQGAAKTVLDAAFPLASVTLDVELPVDPEGVSSMGWAEMQALAAQLTSG